MEPGAADTPPPWYAALPEPRASCQLLEQADVAELLESHAALGPHSRRSFLLVDVRRTDWEGGSVATSINLPAHTLYQTRPALHQLCRQAGIKTIIFFCGAPSCPSDPSPPTIRPPTELTGCAWDRELEREGPALRRLDARLPR